MDSDGDHCPYAYPFSEATALEFDPIYARLLRSEPMPRVHPPHGDDPWLLVRYEDVQAALTDQRFSRAAAVVNDAPRPFEHRVDGGILDLDPPEHTRLRRLVARAFTVRRVETLRPRSREIANRLIDAMIEAGPPIDLVEAFAIPFPGEMICELLGVPFEDRSRYRRWSDAFMSTTGMTAEQRMAEVGEMAGHLAGLIAERRRENSDDLLGALVAASEQDESLTDAELTGLAVTLFTAGYESTANELANFVYLLVTEHGGLRPLHERPDLVPGAVEELLRFVPLSVNEIMLPRYALTDVELSAGTVRAGEPVLASMNAANRDPAVYDDPDRLDLERTLGKPHLTFGHGVHHCIGAPLARLDLQEGLSVLAARLPELKLAVEPGDVVWKSGNALRGPVELPVAW